MFYDRHLSRPAPAVFETYKKKIPNFSLRMTNLQAALIRPQLGMLGTLGERWNARYATLETELNRIDHIRVPPRHAKEMYIGSSIQFTVEDVSKAQVARFVEVCGQRGVEIKWFGREEPAGFTSSYENWAYLGDPPTMNRTRHILDFMCDMRIPLTFSIADCRTIAAVIHAAAGEVFADNPFRR